LQRNLALEQNPQLSRFHLKLAPDTRIEEQVPKENLSIIGSSHFGIFAFRHIHTSLAIASKHSKPLVAFVFQLFRFP
jgi:hypothetical protein